MLHHRLQRLRVAAGLPSSISALRIFDVLAWMSVRSHGPRLVGAERIES
ncbi:DUF6308 family protein [Dactylosporangium maewongense]